MSQVPCTCADKRIYACQGCGRVVNASSGIEYTTNVPYPHSKWFCDVSCVYQKHNAILRYISSGDIDADDEQTLGYLDALVNIESSTPITTLMPHKVHMETESPYGSCVVNPGHLRTSGVVCT